MIQCGFGPPQCNVPNNNDCYLKSKVVVVNHCLVMLGRMDRWMDGMCLFGRFLLVMKTSKFPLETRQLLGCVILHYISHVYFVGMYCKIAKQTYYTNSECCILYPPTLCYTILQMPKRQKHLDRDETLQPHYQRPFDPGSEPHH